MEEMTLEMKNAINRRRDMLERGAITDEEYNKFINTITKVDEPAQVNINTFSPINSTIDAIESGIGWGIFCGILEALFG